MNQNYHKYFIYHISILFIMFSITSCSLHEQPKFDCISPYKGYSIPLDEWDETKLTPTLVPINNSWKVMLEDLKFGYADQLLFSRVDQLWILRENLFRYTPSTGQLKQYYIEANNEKGTPQRLFMSKSGTLWALGSDIKGKQPILNRFNIETDSFEPVVDSFRLLLMESERNMGIAEDSKGQLWLAVPSQGVFVFNPITLSVEKVISPELDHGELNGDITIDLNNSVWIGTRLTGWSTYILHFDPVSQQNGILPLGVTGEDPPEGLMIDRESRLWVGDYAFWKLGTPLPKEGYTGLNLIFRSPVFITQRYPFNNFKWLRPRVILEDSEGAIWYSSFGLTRFDPNTGEWCKVLDSGAINIGLAEDSQGNLWTVVDNKLLKHDK